MPMSATARPEPADHDRDRQGDLRQLVDADVGRRQHEVGARHDRERQQPAEGEADKHVGPVLVEVRRVQPSSTAPLEKKNTS